MGVWINLIEPQKNIHTLTKLLVLLQRLLLANLEALGLLGGEIIIVVVGHFL